MKKIRTKTLLVLLVSFFVFEACSKIPITGRKQFRMLPESTLMEMSLTSYKHILDTAAVEYNTNRANMVKSVGQKIAGSVETYLKGTRYEKRIEGFEWEFNLIQDTLINAWCMSGGKVAFYTGILPICETETGVAVVMGHEIAHAIAQHGNERVSQGLALQMGGVALDVAASTRTEETRALIQMAYGLGANVGVMLPFSRRHESEADEMGLMFMAMAGYDPQEAPLFWDRMNAMGGQRPPEFLSTHPDPDKRKQNLQELMPEALELYNKNK
ncbi:MAG: M48 family metallopeptidase [Bacteroidia bacterium]